MDEPPQRRVIHVDMDCFYAAIEVRDHPELEGKPVAVGGRGGRGVLTTCNYEARKYGCRSAMPVFQAKRLCPALVLMPVRFDAYRAESARIRAIFSAFTDLVEPLSLDEAYLDVSHLRSRPSAVAWEIRHRIREETALTASAGIGPNKFLAKIASDWDKPDGQFEVEPGAVADFLRDLPVRKIWGVGRRTAGKLESLGIRTCGELRQWSELELAARFGKFGRELHQLCRGIDLRPVEPHRERKSLSNEHTFSENIDHPDEGAARLAELIAELEEDLEKHRDRRIRECVVKLKFEDFRTTTAQGPSSEIDPELCEELLREAWGRSEGRSVRLIGVGVRFHPQERGEEIQPELF